MARDPISSIEGRRRSFLSFGWPARTTERTPPFTDHLNQALESDERFAVQIMSVINEQDNGFLPFLNQLMQRPFPFFGLSGNLKILLDGQIVK